MSENFTYDELYNLATEADVTGRGDMTKAELREAIQEEAPHLLDPFAAAETVDIGDRVSMNHLSGDLFVTGVATYDGEQVTFVTDDDEEVAENDSAPRVEVVMETIRGGRHKLVCRKQEPFSKNGEEAHLERWRAGDKEWMNNSTDPVFIRPVGDDDEEGDDE